MLLKRLKLKSVSTLWVSYPKTGPQKPPVVTGKVSLVGLISLQLKGSLSWIFLSWVLLEQSLHILATFHSSHCFTSQTIVSMARYLLRSRSCAIWKKVYMGGNNLTGTLPLSYFNNMPKLETLLLDRNNFTGTLSPYFLDNMNSLKTLRLNHNSLHGNIPEEFGPIPSSIIRCQQLRYLSMSYNKLNGTIPRGIGNLTLLKEIFLGENDLQGVCGRRNRSSQKKSAVAKELISNQISDKKNSVVAKTRSATKTAVVANPDQQSSRNTITHPDRISAVFQEGWILKCNSNQELTITNTRAGDQSCCLSFKNSPSDPKAGFGMHENAKDVWRALKVCFIGYFQVREEEQAREKAALEEQKIAREEVVKDQDLPETQQD
ncbi:hypothetical protein L1987_59119 [Smallanthus sonchifolius]|uniref:Uncharacterized protein n=1 Tax=Smallanthus sonchifolius TaxID=185202 RepID=A0ACB9D4Z1_9ASTR|nr:hypothetical protein L1987_59119 [Smallanthus sonchifolius]